MKYFSLLISLMLLSLFNMAFASGGNENYPMQAVHINLNDKASLQRGAKWYMNYCSGCHSLNYLRYSRMALDIGIVDSNGEINAKLLKNNLIFTNAKTTDHIATSMSVTEAKQWFGVVPPDLTLEARVRGPQWLYNYLLNFYSDPKRPFGTNNALFPDVAMPNVLINLQGIQIPIYRKQTFIIDGKTQQIAEIDHLVLVKNGLMSPVQFAAAMNDLVNFLTYASEPVATTRKHLGVWVLLFLVVFAIFAYFLKREYWKNIK